MRNYNFYKMLGNNVFLFFIFVMFFNSFSKAQEIKKYEKKEFIREDGRYFINKELPIYLRLANKKEENAESHLLESESSKDFVNPFYFSKEGKNILKLSVKVLEKGRKKNINFEVYADGKSPISNVNLTNSYLYKKDKNIYTSDTVIQIISNDKLSGVQEVNFSVKGKDFQKYENGIFLKYGEGEQNIKYYSVDNVGNIEKLKEQKIIMDLTPPVSKPTVNVDYHLLIDSIGKEHHIASQRSNISLNAVDTSAGVDKIFCQLNGEKMHIFKKNISLKNLIQDKHHLKHYSIDNVKNQELLEDFVFQVDSSPPIVIEEILGNMFMASGVSFTSGRSKFKIKAEDNIAGVKEILYQINDNEIKKYTKEFYLPSEIRQITITYWALDNVNNKSGFVKRYNRKEVYMDLAGPELNHKFEGPTFKIFEKDTIIISPKTKIILIGKDEGASLKKIEYEVDKEEKKLYDKDTSFTISKKGKHRIVYYGFDNLDNRNYAYFYCKVDNTPPVLEWHFSVKSIGKKLMKFKKTDVYPTYVKLYLAATDDEVGTKKIFYKVNKEKEKTYIKEISFKKKRNNIVKVRVIDELGNEAKHEIRFIIDESNKENE